MKDGIGAQYRPTHCECLRNVVTDSGVKTDRIPTNSIDKNIDPVDVVASACAGCTALETPRLNPFRYDSALSVWSTPIHKRFPFCFLRLKISYLIFLITSSANKKLQWFPTKEVSFEFLKYVIIWALFISFPSSWDFRLKWKHYNEILNSIHSYFYTFSCNLFILHCQTNKTHKETNKQNVHGLLICCKWTTVATLCNASTSDWSVGGIWRKEKKKWKKILTILRGKILESMSRTNCDIRCHPDHGSGNRYGGPLSRQM